MLTRELQLLFTRTTAYTNVTQNKTYWKIMILREFILNYLRPHVMQFPIAPCRYIQ
jgi:hypothetical protein